MFGPDVQLSLPPGSWFNFPPNNYPKPLPPPQPYGDEFTWKAPIAINPKLYQDALDYRLPATFAAIYVVSIFAFNQINRSRNNKAFGISKSPVFTALVFVHNAVLAGYSLVTCIALIRAISVSVPGIDEAYGLAGTVDGLCKINGPRGFGDAITYNSTLYTWASKNHKIHLSDDLLTPDSTDVGRIWNEGLAFWGWVFYISKFYEVIDNVVLILKGKRVTTLQTFHHAGALLCMWAGIRYMSPPIWMFVLVNSGIHAMMYTYYTFCTVGIRPSKAVKKIITTLQIAQFMVGMTYAAIHLFVSYTAPYPVAYTVTSILHGMPEAVSSMTHAAAASLHSAAAHFDHYDRASLAHDADYVANHAKTIAHNAAHNMSSLAHVANSVYHTGLSSKTISSAASSAASVATESASSFIASVYSEATTTAASLASTASRSAPSIASEASATIAALASKALADDGLWLKKLLYRAAGREALAEAIRNKDDVLFGPEFDENLIPRTFEHVVEEVKYRTEYGTVRCLDYEGQAFAIWLNVLYLVPLTGLFSRFFYKTYSKDDKKRTVNEAAGEAAQYTIRAVEKAGKRTEKRMGAVGKEVKSIGDDIAIKAEDGQFGQEFSNVRDYIQDRAARLNENVGDVYAKMKREFDDFDVNQTIEKARHGVENIVHKVTDATHGGDHEHNEGESDTDNEHDDEHSSAVKIKREDGGRNKESLSQSVQSVSDSIKSSVSNLTSSSGTGNSGVDSEKTTPSKKHKKKKKSNLPVPSANDGKPSGPGGGSAGSASGSSSSPSGAHVSVSSNGQSHSQTQNTNKSSSTSTHTNIPSTPQTPSKSNTHASQDHGHLTAASNVRSSSPSKQSTPARSISPTKSSALRSLSPTKATSRDSFHTASHSNAGGVTTTTTTTRTTQSSHTTSGTPKVATTHVIDMHTGAAEGVVPHAKPHSWAEAAAVPTLRESMTYEKVEAEEAVEEEMP